MNVAFKSLLFYFYRQKSCFFIIFKKSMAKSEVGLMLFSILFLGILCSCSDASIVLQVVQYPTNLPSSAQDVDDYQNYVTHDAQFAYFFQAQSDGATPTKTFPIPQAVSNQNIVCAAISKNSKLIIIGISCSSSSCNDTFYYAARASIQEEFSDLLYLGKHPSAWQSIQGECEISLDGTSFYYETYGIVAPQVFLCYGPLTNTSAGYSFNRLSSFLENNELLTFDISETGRYNILKYQVNLVAAFDLLYMTNLPYTFQTYEVPGDLNVNSFSLSKQEPILRVVSVDSTNTLTINQFDTNSRQFLPQTIQPLSVKPGSQVLISRDGRLLAVYTSTELTIYYINLLDDNTEELIAAQIVQGSFSSVIPSAFQIKSTRDYAFAFRSNPDSCFLILEFEISGNEIKVDCETQYGSTHVEIQENVCQCYPYYSWDEKTLICTPDCNSLYSEDVNPEDPMKCTCSNGAIWEQSLKRCAIDCISDQYSTQQWLTDQLCKCKHFSEWNTKTQQCQPSCAIIENAIGVSSQSIDCLCSTNYTWNFNTLRCALNCSTVIHANVSSGDLEINPGECSCEEGFYWRTGECIILDCTKIPYSSGQLQSGICSCQQKFAWVYPISLCGIVCSQFSQDSRNLLVSNGLYSCECEEGSYWQQNDLKCYLNCSQVSFSTGVNKNTDQCFCLTNYIWESQTSSCKLMCGLNVGEDSSFNTDEGHCNCLADFYFSYEKNLCYRDCWNVDNAIRQDGPNPDECSCNANYVWSSISKTCDLACQGSFDLGINQDKTACLCQLNALFNNRLGKCSVNCLIDPLSTKIYDPVSEKCACKQDAYWISDENKCSCIEGYAFNSQSLVCEIVAASFVIPTAVGSVILLGGSAAGFYVFKNKRKRAKQEKEVQHHSQISEHKGMESEKDIQLHEIV